MPHHSKPRKARAGKARRMFAVMSAARYGTPQICTEHPERPLIYEHESDAVARMQPSMHETVAPVFILPATPEAQQQIHQQIKLALDHEDGTGAGYDYAAHRVMRKLGLTEKTFVRFLQSLTPPTSEEKP